MYNARTEKHFVFLQKKLQEEAKNRNKSDLIYQRKGFFLLSNNKYVSGISSWTDITLDCSLEIIYY